MINITIRDQVNAVERENLPAWAFGFLWAAVESFLDERSDRTTLKETADELYVAYINRLTPITGGNVSPPAAPSDVPDRA